MLFLVRILLQTMPALRGEVRIWCIVALKKVKQIDGAIRCHRINLLALKCPKHIFRAVLGPGSSPNGSAAPGRPFLPCQNPKRSHLDPIQRILHVFFVFLQAIFYDISLASVQRETPQGHYAPDTDLPVRGRRSLKWYFTRHCMEASAAPNKGQ